MYYKKRAEENQNKHVDHLIIHAPFQFNPFVVSEKKLFIHVLIF
jgi:hypothetical protein